MVTYEEWDREYNNGEDDYCDTIPPRFPITQTKFLGHYFCAKRTADSFIRAVRVDPISKLCPQGTEPCSPATSPENTICQPPEDHADKCPITEILFVTGAEIAPYQQNPTYTVKPIPGGWVDYLVYSKTSSDNLPITTTKVEAENPCTYPDRRNDNGRLKYPLEADRFKSSCWGTDDTSMMHWNNIDERFIDTGGYDTEYDIQSES